MLEQKQEAFCRQQGSSSAFNVLVSSLLCGADEGDEKECKPGQRQRRAEENLQENHTLTMDFFFFLRLNVLKLLLYLLLVSTDFPFVWKETRCLNILGLLSLKEASEVTFLRWH